LRRFLRFSALAFAAAIVAGCGGGGRSVAIPSDAGASSGLSAPEMNALYPSSQSPASFDPAPMPQVQDSSPSGMADVPRSAVPLSIRPLQWTQLPGTASRVVVSTDGSLWALATSPAGSDKYLHHYTNGRWTSVPGLAASIAFGVDGTLYAVNVANGGVYAYDGSSWSAIGGGARWVTTGRDGAVYILSRNNLVNGDSAIWKYANGAWTQQPGRSAQLAGSLDSNSYSVKDVGTIAFNGYFALNSSGALFYYSPGSGYVHLPGAASGIAPVSGGVLELAYPPSSAGQGVSYFDYASATLTAEAGSGANLAAGAGPGGHGTQLYLVNAQNAIWTTLIVTASVTEYALPATSGLPHEIVAGSDGALWFTETDLDKIGRMTPGGSVTDFAIPTAHCRPWDIAAGPDGALWFTESSAASLPYRGDKIGRITPDGNVTEYAVAPYSSPYGIAAGPDGALWFTEFQGNNIGRITSGGSVTEYPLPTAFSYPNGIAAGPDGALWFTESAKIGRITTGGSISEFAIPTAGGGPSGIAAGPDGALWFTEIYGNKIGRITAGGSISEFPLPTANAMPNGIVAGSDGALWFTEFQGNKIGRIATSGTIGEFAILTAASGPYGIAAGPGNALWFAEFDGNQLGKIVP
jgi:streptogramin lyase